MGVSPRLCAGAGPTATAGSVSESWGWRGAGHGEILLMHLLPLERVREGMMRHPGAVFSVKQRAALVSENTLVLLPGADG